VADLTPLKGLTSLQRLHLSSTPVADLTPLEGLASLQSLNLSSTPVTDLTPLKGLTSLQRLHLNSTPVADLTPLKGLTNLEWLELNSTKVLEPTISEFRQAPPESLHFLQRVTGGTGKIASYRHCRHKKPIARYFASAEVGPNQTLRESLGLKRATRNCFVVVKQ